MLKKKITTALLSLGSVTALAGTMGAVEPAMDFDGFYLGLGSGVSSLFHKDISSSVESDGHNNFYDTSRGVQSDLIFTGNIGYGKMFAEKTYLGAKASIYYNPAEHSYVSSSFDLYKGHNYVSSHKSSGSFLPTYNLDLMLGYEVIPHFLPFVEAGVTFSDFRGKDTISASRTNLNGSGAIAYTTPLNIGGYNTNYNVGLGGYYLVHKNWFFSSELVYTDFGKYNVSGVELAHLVFDSATETLSKSWTGSALNLFFGVNYLFSL